MSAILSRRHRMCWHFMARYTRASGGVAPTLREIARGIGLSPTSWGHASSFVRDLESAGLVRRLVNRARGHEAIGRLPGPQPIPVYDAQTGRLREFLPSEEGAP